MKAAIYARKSRATEKGESVEHQIARGIAYCESKDWEHEVYCDYDFSGGYTKRPEFEKMMKDIDSGKFDALVCYKLARVCRNVKDFANFFDYLFQRDVSFVSLKENFDTSTSLGRAGMYISAVIAEMERDNVSEQVTDNMIDRAKEGKWNGGPVPIGYSVVKEEGINIKGNKKITSKLIINEDESKIIKFIFNEYLKTDGSIRGITKKLIINGYKTKNDKLWRDNQVNRVLKNALYCVADEEAFNYFNDDNNPIVVVDKKELFNCEHGLMFYNRRKQKNYTTTTPRNKEEWILAIGEHKGIIPGEIFVKAQKKINLNKTRAPRFGTSTQSPLSGLVRCNKCKTAMTVRTAKMNNKDEGYSYNYFECRKKVESSGLLCDTGNVNAKDLEKRIIKLLKEFFSNQDKLKDIIKNYETQIKNKKVDNNEIMNKQNNIKNELKKIEGGIKNLVNALAENLIPANMIREKYKELEAKRDLLESELNKLGLQLLNNKEIKIDIDFISESLKKFDVDNLNDIDFNTRKNFYIYLIKNIYIDDKIIEIEIFLNISGRLFICNRKDMDSLKQPS